MHVHRIQLHMMLTILLPTIQAIQTLWPTSTTSNETPSSPTTNIFSYSALLTIVPRYSLTAPLLLRGRIVPSLIPEVTLLPTSTLQNKDVGGYLIRALLIWPLRLRRFKTISYVFLNLLTAHQECVIRFMTPATHLKPVCLFFAKVAANFT